MNDPQRKAKRPNNSSGFFSQIQKQARPLYNSMGGGTPLPGLLQSTHKLNLEISQNSSQQSTAPSEMIVDMGDGHQTLVDIDALYASEAKTGAPDIPRVDKVCLTHALNDFLDMSLHEYSVHYISHTQLPADGPFPEIAREVLESTDNFFKATASQLPYDIWVQVAEGYKMILSSVGPP